MVFKLKFLKKLRKTTPHREVYSFSRYQLLFTTLGSIFVYNLKINYQNNEEIQNTKQIPKTHSPKYKSFLNFMP